VKASRLIQLLKALIAKHGDRWVIAASYDSFGEVDVVKLWTAEDAERSVKLEPPDPGCFVLGSDEPA